MSNLREGVWTFLNADLHFILFLPCEIYYKIIVSSFELITEKLWMNELLFPQSKK